MAPDSSAATETVLTTEVLSRSFGGLRAVSDVSLTLARGELHAVIGPNGAGKSTLVNLLSGELAPTTGRIRLGALDVTHLPVNRRVHLGIARSFQRTNIFAPLSMLENVRLAAQAVGGGDLAARARAALERVGLPLAHHRAAGVLSHGQQRQLEIAMALVSQPKVLLLDEPLAGMGQEEGDRMARLLQGLAKEHAVLLIEHDMDFVFKVADRMTVMVEGAVLASGRPAEVRANAAVQTAYLGGHA
jgi:branched-chain amino acid transport system ATP-binding protein